MGIGGVVSVVTALVSAWGNARVAEQQFAREAEQQKLASLEAVLDAAGLALEEAHWALRAAVEARKESPESTSLEDPGAKAWRRMCERMDAAKADVSRQGTRLAIRLGVAAASVEAYNSVQRGYRELVDEVRAFGEDAEVAEFSRRLDELGSRDQPRFLDEAKNLLIPRTI